MPNYETKMTCKLFYRFFSKGTQHSSSFFQGKDHSNFDKLHGLLNKPVNLLSHLNLFCYTVPFNSLSR